MTADQTQPVQFPDVNPSDLPPTSDFSMAAGDFLEVYQTPGKFVIEYYLIKQKYKQRMIFMSRIRLS